MTACVSLIVRLNKKNGQPVTGAFINAFVRCYHSADELIVLIDLTLRNYGAAFEKMRTNPERERKRKSAGSDSSGLENFFLASGFVIADDVSLATFDEKSRSVRKAEPMQLSKSFVAC
jgi:hypothetical protein